MPSPLDPKLPTKLGLKPSQRVAILDSPKGFQSAMEVLVPGVEIRPNLRSKKDFDFILLFAPKAAHLRRRMVGLPDRLDPDGSLWIAWPKKSSPLAGDLDHASVQQAGLNAGMVDNKICAVDDDWSGLRFVFRLQDRPKIRAQRL